MKRYKLVKGLPTFNAGDVFYLNEAGSLIHESDGVVAYNWITIDKFPNILTDWFEEIEEQTRWKPEMDQKYYLLDSNGYAHDSVWSNDYIDRNRSEIGNCFESREEAERVREYLKALAVVRGDATSEFAKYNDNWFIGYDPEHKSIDAFCNSYTARNGIFGLPYFATREDAQRSIKQHKDEWLTIFGVKEEE